MRSSVCPTADFKFVHGVTEAEKKKDVIGGFMGMLMEGMRRLDDRRED